MAVLGLWQASRWIPRTLDLLRLPDGSISHDPWAWLPLGLVLATMVAIAAPVSFRSVVDLLSSFPFKKGPP